MDIKVFSKMIIPITVTMEEENKQIDLSWLKSCIKIHPSSR
jgi:hypothetical protein